MKIHPFSRCFLIIAACVGLIACNAPESPSSYGKGERRVQVSINLKPSSSPLINPALEPLPALSGFQLRQVSSPQTALVGIPDTTQTALIIAVPETASFSEEYRSVVGAHDTQLIDLASSSVTLTLPLDVPLVLFEYTFDTLYTLAELQAASRFVVSAAKLGPFTVTADTTVVQLKAALELALSGPFADLLATGSFRLGSYRDQGQVLYYYSQTSWKQIVGDRYVLDPTTRTFSLDDSTNDEPRYRLENNDWVLGDDEPKDAVFESADNATHTLFYSNPTFSVQLVAVKDLSGLSEPLDIEGETLDGVTFSEGALGYVMEVDGLFADSYVLERVEESHDCTYTQFASLAEFIEYASTSVFACSDKDGHQCLRFDGYTTGQTSGVIVEELRDTDYTLTDSYNAGTWEIKTIQTKELLFFYPDSTVYYHNDVWSSFWSVYDGKVWQGRYSTETVAEKFKFMELNSVAVDDVKNHLIAAPASLFIDESDQGDSDGDSCGSSDSFYLPSGSPVSIDGNVSSDWYDKYPIQLDLSGDVDSGVTDATGDIYLGSNIRSFWAATDPTADALYLRLDLWDNVNTNFRHMGSPYEGNYQVVIYYDSGSSYSLGIAYNEASGDWEIGYNGTDGPPGILGPDFVGVAGRHIEVQVPLSELGGSGTQFQAFRAEVTNCCTTGWGIMDWLEVPNSNPSIDEATYIKPSVAGANRKALSISSPTGSGLSIGTPLSVTWSNGVGEIDGSTVSIYVLYDDTNGLDSTDDTELATIVSSRRWYRMEGFEGISNTGSTGSIDPFLFNREGYGIRLLIVDDGGNWEISPEFSVFE